MGRCRKLQQLVLVRDLDCRGLHTDTVGPERCKTARQVLRRHAEIGGKCPFFIRDHYDVGAVVKERFLDDPVGEALHTASKLLRLQLFDQTTIGVAGVLYFVGIKDQPNAFWGFFASFILLFFATGIGNASTFQMIPAIMSKEMDRLMPNATPEERRHEADKESAAITGFTSAIAAFGAFFIPKGYGTSISMTGGPEAALWAFLIFYVTCLVITWGVYTRKGGLLYDVEHRSKPAAAAA